MGRRKKKHTHVEVPPYEDDSTPKSFVFSRGKISPLANSLCMNARKMMEPHTARNLKVRRKNQLRDLVHVAGPLGVTHFMAFTQTDIGLNMRLMRAPQGPTLTFRVSEYSLMKDVALRQRHPHSPGVEFRSPPLLVLNNFSGEEVEVKLMAAMLQHLFPSINVSKSKLSDLGRVVLFQRDKESGLVSLRQYAITASPVGLTKTVKKIIKAKLPNLSKFEDISQYVFGDAPLSDSEAEDAAESKVTLAQDMHGRGNKKSGQSAIRLTELGPRMTLELLKIEEGLNEGRVVFNSLVKKTPEEISALAAAHKRRLALKQQRRAQQEKNVAAKKALKTKKKHEEGGSEGDSEESEEEEEVEEVPMKKEKKMPRGKETKKRKRVDPQKQPRIRTKKRKH